MTTYPHCQGCGGDLVYKPANACEPRHYECRKCHTIWKTPTEAFGVADKLRLGETRGM